MQSIHSCLYRLYPSREVLPRVPAFYLWQIVQLIYRGPSGLPASHLPGQAAAWQWLPGSGTWGSWHCPGHCAAVPAGTPPRTGSGEGGTSPASQCKSAWSATHTIHSCNQHSVSKTKKARHTHLAASSTAGMQIWYFQNYALYKRWDFSKSPSLCPWATSTKTQHKFKKH